MIFSVALLSPSRWSPQYKPICFDDLVGKHAPGKCSSVEVETHIRDVFEGVGMSLGRKHDDHALLRKQLLDLFDRANQVAIGRDEQCYIKAILESVSQ